MFVKELASLDQKKAESKMAIFNIMETFVLFSTIITTSSIILQSIYSWSDKTVDYKIRTPVVRDSLYRRGGVNSSSHIINVTRNINFAM